MKRYRYISIGQVAGETFERHPLFSVVNNKSNQVLAEIFWYAPWKQYVLRTDPQAVFNDSCLRDILNFMEHWTNQAEALTEAATAPLAS